MLVDSATAYWTRILTSRPIPPSLQHNLSLFFLSCRSEWRLHEPGTMCRHQAKEHQFPDRLGNKTIGIKRIGLGQDVGKLSTNTNKTVVKPRSWPLILVRCLSAIPADFGLSRFCAISFFLLFVFLAVGWLPVLSLPFWVSEFGLFLILQARIESSSNLPQLARQFTRKIILIFAPPGCLVVVLLFLHKKTSPGFTSAWPLVCTAKVRTGR